MRFKFSGRYAATVLGIHLLTLAGCALPVGEASRPVVYESVRIQLLSLTVGEETRVMRAVLLTGRSGFSLMLSGEFDLPLLELTVDRDGLRVERAMQGIPDGLAHLAARDIYLSYFAGGLPEKGNFTFTQGSKRTMRISVDPSGIEKRITFSNGESLLIRMERKGDEYPVVRLDHDEPSYHLSILTLKEFPYIPTLGRNTEVESIFQQEENNESETH